MRKSIDDQLKFGEVDISKIEFNPRERDAIPQLLKGLQHIYMTPELRERVFDLLREAAGNTDQGRSGMELWKILVLGTLRLNCDWSYDTLKNMADNHKMIRLFLGHGDWLDCTSYPLQTLKDNVRLLTDDLLDQINVEVVRAGHNLVKKKEEEEKLEARCDSFVVEANAHYPTDANLLWDAARRMILLTIALCVDLEIDGWRQGAHHLRVLKSLFNAFRRASSRRSEEKKLVAITAYLGKSVEMADRVETTCDQIDEATGSRGATIEIRVFLEHAKRQIDQLERRVVKGEVIPHDEKVFSVFEPYVRWISKGKAGVPQEIGLPVCVMEDQYGFLLGSKVMVEGADVDVAVDMVSSVKANFAELNSCSFDKGFWSPKNFNALEKELEHLVMPKKGGLSQTERKREEAPNFVEAKRRHAAVESAINALENHGLDRCPDRTLKGFKRYVSMAVLARNIQKLGSVIQNLEREKERRSAAIKEGLRKKRAEKLGELEPAA